MTFTPSPPPKSKSWKERTNEIQANVKNETPQDARPTAAASVVGEPLSYTNDKSRVTKAWNLLKNLQVSEAS